MAWVEQRGNLHVGYYRDSNGKKQRAGSDKGKRAALKLAQDQEAMVRAGTWTDKTLGAMTLDTYFYTHWLPNRMVQPRTRVNNLYDYKTTIGPALGNLPLNKITPPVVQRWIIGLEQAGELAPSTIVVRHRTLSSILGMKKGVSALRDGLITSNPCQFTTLPARNQTAVKFFEVEEADRIIKALPEWYRTFVLFLVESGLRWGEATGLLVGDFDKDFGGFWVRRTIVRIPEREAKQLGIPHGLQIQPSTKNHKERYVGLSLDAATAIATLVRERKLKPADRLFTDEVPRGSGKVNRNEQWPEGAPVDSPLFRNRVWVKALKKAKVPYRKPHALRASHITWLLSGGLDLPTVMRRVGHSALSTTQVYSGQTRDETDRTMDALDGYKNRNRIPMNDPEALEKWLDDDDE